MSLELAEHLRVGLAGDVREDVEAAPVRHADCDLEDVVMSRGLEDRVEKRNERLAALEGEALLADVLGLEEGLEGLCLIELVQDPQLLLAIGLRVRDLHAVLNPLALIGILDVHVLDADCSRVRIAQDAEDLAQLHEGLAAEATGGEFPVEVPQREAVLENIEVGVHALVVFERIDVGHEVAAHPVRVNDLLNPDCLVEVGLVAR
ncbi:unannotated protein [freshwater metagenome]|uniref:Unannotated protein n=1 Tax=freshwater metagenome TaxID=449393 RepID=A0A6J7HII6_9ZZZZ